MVVEKRDGEAVAVADDVGQVGEGVVGAAARGPHHVGGAVAAFDQKIEGFFKVGLVLVGRAHDSNVRLELPDDFGVEFPIEIAQQGVNFEVQVKHAGQRTVEDHHVGRPFEQLTQQLAAARRAVGNDEGRFLVFADDVVGGQSSLQFTVGSQSDTKLRRLLTGN